MPSNEISLKGKTALVTGASRGIGKAIAQAMAQAGATVIGTGRSQLDLTDEGSVAAFVERIGRLRKLDILVNNAGINKVDAIQDVRDEDWERVVRVNLTGARKLMTAAARHMISRKVQGRILNISSIFGVISRAKRNAYSASKAGLIGLTQASSLDLAPHGILVNALCPGFVLTDMTKSILSPAEIRELCGRVPMGRFAKPQEIARAALFLCSSQNSYMTGQTLIVDGGYSVQ